MSQNLNSEEAGKVKMVRGPRRLEYLPEQYRCISGIDHLTTVRQLDNLEKWLSTPVAHRPVYVKLGCSVSHGVKRHTNPPRSTWVAMVNGEPQIIHLVMDPRSAYKWISCSARPWNIAEKHEPTPEAPRYWIAVMERMHGYQLEPNGTTIVSVTRRKLRKGLFEGKMELLVEGAFGWWEQDDLGDRVIRVRAAVGEIYCGEDGSLWVTATQARPFPAYTFADWVLMESNREAVENVDAFIEDRAVEKVWHKIHFTNAARPIPTADEGIIRSVLKKVDLNSIASKELDALVPYISELLTAVGSN